MTEKENVFVRFFRWVKRWLTGKRSTTIYRPTRTSIPVYYSPSRGKEDRKTKVRRKMAERSRRINRLREK